MLANLSIEVAHPVVERELALLVLFSALVPGIHGSAVLQVDLFPILVQPVELPLELLPPLLDGIELRFDLALEEDALPRQIGPLLQVLLDGLQ